VKETVELWWPLFPTTQMFREVDYLSFLAERLPTDIADQLNRDAQPDLSLNRVIDIADLVRPLSAGAFPSDKLYDITDVLSFTLMVYQGKLGESDSAKPHPFKVIYGASLYLHCLIHGHGKPRHGAFTVALGMLANTCVRLDLQTRLQVSRFLGSLLPVMRTEDIWEYAPLSSVLALVCIIVGSILDQLAVLTGETMKSEDIGKAWKEVEGEERAPSDEAISDLKRLISEMFGPQGRVRQSADQLLSAISGIPGTHN
jgi:hypothetical protein